MGGCKNIACMESWWSCIYWRSEQWHETYCPCMNGEEGRRSLSLYMLIWMGELILRESAPYLASILNGMAILAIEHT